MVLFDQDSTVTEGFMSGDAGGVRAHPQRDKVAIVTPSQVERSIGRTRRPWFAKDGARWSRSLQAA